MTTPQIVRLPSRLDLPVLFTQLGLTGLGAELGVASGIYSDAILRRWPGTLISIDAWAGDRGHDQAQYRQARARLAKWGERSRILAMTFDEALVQIPDGALDWVYIDGYAHTGNRDGETFRAWWPKVREGGLIGGHDYSDQWPANREAVDRFAAWLGVQTMLITDDEPASWAVRRRAREESAITPHRGREESF